MQAEWKLVCLTHNILKLLRSGKGFSYWWQVESIRDPSKLEANKVKTTHLARFCPPQSRSIDVSIQYVAQQSFNESLIPNRLLAKSIDMYEVVKAMLPETLRRIAGTVTTSDDRTTPGLQAADLLVGLRKKTGPGSANAESGYFSE